MKNLFTLALVAALVAPVFAQEAETAAAAPEAREQHKRESSMWPAFVAVCDYPEAADVIGFRLSIPYAIRQDNVTGFDLGFWGRCNYFEGLQVNILRNDVHDSASAVQIGLYNSVGVGNCIGVQVGLWNEAGALVGVQGGLVNISGETEGFQLGLINRAETLHGYQVGVINIIRDAEVRFCPIVNIGF